MGCACSKRPDKMATESPDFECNVAENAVGLQCVTSPSREQDEGGRSDEDRRLHKVGSRDSRRLKKGRSSSTGFSIKLGLSHRHVEAEQIAAGWPAWLTAAASEAVYGMVPLKAESLEKLDKIGQGTYSSVFRAREVATGRMVALKKVRFDNFQPESIRFMAREIMILRRLDHPNIMKLEGVITSRLSSTIYLVFELMEHDLAGLSSASDVSLSESQIKCYMKQLLLAVEHCHLRGIMHRDIKPSNILVNNEGILKLGDFGLANTLNPKHRQKLTSRVVTLWYRPPELLMGSTNYNVSVDLWSVGCVFAELLFRKPVLKGRTEVEQLHKIFKLCGSPPEEFWKSSKLPQGDMFKPQSRYEGYLKDKCADLRTSTVNLLQQFLSIDPAKRGTASSALMAEYFQTQPFACDPSNLPKYPPRKEMDAKHRDDARRKKARARLRDTGLAKKHRKNHLGTIKELQESGNFAGRSSGNKGKFDSISAMSQHTSTSQATSTSQGLSTMTVPAQNSASSGFAWAKRQNDDTLTTLSVKSNISGMESNLGFINHSIDLPKEKKTTDNSTANRMQHMNLKPLDRSETFDIADVYRSNDLSGADSDREKRDHSSEHSSNQVEVNVQHSGPLLSESQKIDELLQRNESNIRQAARRSRFYRER